MTANDNHKELFDLLIQRLNKLEINVGLETCVRIQKLIQIYEVSTEEELKKLRDKIIPIVAKNADEQKRLKHLFDDDETVRAPINGRGQTKKKSNKSQPFLKEILQDPLAIPRITALLFFILVPLYFIFFKPEKPAVSFSTEDIYYLKVGRNVMFHNLGDLKNGADYIWNFGDSSAPLASNNYTVLHPFNKEGTFQVSLSGHFRGGKDSTFKSDIDVKDSCFFQPSITTQQQNESKLSGPLVFFFRNDSKGKPNCADSVVWTFSDGISVKTDFNKNYIAHEFTNDSDPSATLTIFSKNGASYQLSAHLSSILVLYAMDSITVPPNPSPKITKSKDWMSIFLISAIVEFPIAIVAFLVLDSKRRRRRRKFQNEPNEDPLPVGEINYEYPDQDGNINYSSLRNTIESFGRKKELGIGNTINFPETIDATIRKGGYPTIIFGRVKFGQSYIFLIDLGSGYNMQSELFDSLVRKFKLSGVEARVYYYRATLIHLSTRKDMTFPFSIGDLFNAEASSSLIIMGDGYELLDSIGMKESIGHTVRKWERRILLTPVPGNNWGSQEAALLSILPLLPATEEGIQIMISIINRQIPFFDLNEKNSAIEYQDFPVREVSEYPRFFQYDPITLAWVYSLALFEKPDWNITLAVGEALSKDKNLPNNEELSRYSNLLKLTSLEWMQTGIFKTSQRREMLNALKNLTVNKVEIGQRVIEIVSAAALKLSKEVRLKPGTLAERQKQHSEIVLQQWNIGQNKIADDFEELHRHGMMDSLTRNEFEKKVEEFRKKEPLRRFTKGFFSSLAGLLLCICFLSFLSDKREIFIKTASTNTKFDSSAYYFNLAASSMNLSDYRVQFYFPNLNFTSDRNIPNRAFYGTDLGDSLNLLNQVPGMNDTSLFTNTRLSANLGDFYGDYYSKQIDSNVLAYRRTRFLFRKAHSLIDRQDTQRIRMLRDNERLFVFLVARDLFQKRNFNSALDLLRLDTLNSDSISFRFRAGKIFCLYYLREKNAMCSEISDLKSIVGGENLDEQIVSLEGTFCSPVNKPKPILTDKNPVNSSTTTQKLKKRKIPDGIRSAYPYPALNNYDTSTTQKPTKSGISDRDNPANSGLDTQKIDASKAKVNPPYTQQVQTNLESTSEAIVNNFLYYDSSLSDIVRILDRISYSKYGPAEYEPLQSAISKYNRYYQALTSDSEKFSGFLAGELNNTSLKSAYDRLMVFVTDNIHSGIMLPMNETIIKSLNAYNPEAQTKIQLPNLKNIASQSAETKRQLQNAQNFYHQLYQSFRFQLRNAVLDSAPSKK